MIPLHQPHLGLVMCFTIGLSIEEKIISKGALNLYWAIGFLVQL